MHYSWRVFHSLFLLISFHCGSWILDLVITDLVHICALEHRRHAYSQGELPSLKNNFFPLCSLVLSCLSASSCAEVMLVVQVRLCFTLKAAVGRTLFCLDSSDVIIGVSIVYNIFNSVSTLRWSDFQLKYVWWLQGWSGTENICPITTNTHKYILCLVHPWIILVFSSIFTFSISMHWTCFTPGLSSITSGL